jgi:predicted PhzF superfamily epimerase YddE/YHI9
VTDVHVLRVFTNESGDFGNPLGVVLDTAALTDGDRQAIAARLGFSETVFVDDVPSARLRIFTPATELPLAGHPLVGTAWLLSALSGTPVEVLRPRHAHPVTTWQEDGVSWIRARVTDAPPLAFVQLDSAAAVEAMALPANPPYDHHEFWAWSDRAAGAVRARFFAPAFGIPEDEATGGAALVLVAQLGRPLTITQGRGSVIYARPASDGQAEVGGRVVRDRSRTI